jgi:hypothetical protein
LYDNIIDIQEALTQCVREKLAALQAQLAEKTAPLKEYSEKLMKKEARIDEKIT